MGSGPTGPVVTLVDRSQYYEGLMGLSWDAHWEPLGWLAFINFLYVIVYVLATRFISHQKK